MGELQNAVSALLDAFARGIAVIKTQRNRRKAEKLSIDSTHKTAETRVSKSLKRNKADVQSAYTKDLARFGSGFAAGDAEAHSSLSSILFRLNAGFVSVIERFTCGRSTPTDYQVLVNLSNASRMEAIHTFEQLSRRLSQSSLALVPSNKHNEKRRHKSRTKVDSSLGTPKHARSKSAPQLSITPFGPATSDGWVRPKTGRKLSSDTKATGTSSPKRRATRQAPSPQRLNIPAPPLQSPTTHSPPPIPRATHPSQIQTSPHHRAMVSQPRPGDRKSIMSFASDSTKLGEIPEHKWARPVEGGHFPVRVFYPLEPYQEPEKPRSRLMRLFKRS
ncbi:hypothetical protein D0Z07_6212 [Hyphodiscus hymeniophilus]|uniref:Uncharacterized protein n=1 Tax=Hyphodiscus hymeniophilus TaxID=353542 RepID=A0A9P7AUS3_9HELO|nr:hypothetical protein D0Z07_6212 [Hyphodiscus hymeniophilus]